MVAVWQTFPRYLKWWKTQRLENGGYLINLKFPTQSSQEIGNTEIRNTENVCLHPLAWCQPCFPCTPTQEALFGIH